MLTFDDIIDAFARVSSKKTVVSDDTRSLSYGSLKSNGSNLAAFLKRYEIIKGDRVALLSYNRIEFAEILYATSKLGLIVTPINFRLSKEEIASIVNDANPKFFLYEKAFFKTIILYNFNFGACFVYWRGNHDDPDIFFNVVKSS